ncbi:hypothetical protein NDU88_003483 [Pleurodeles waltl]|uniref:Uncharacterized protein n=1 Tax=Pleurodeles waltl TaxID=8319 RepID=A0AAV7M3I5_PLEWA|nr:hypothetical protein NDU88_003483 [Pleurodeles waltl]
MAAKRVRQNAVRFSAVEDVKMDGLLFRCSVLQKELGFRPDQIDYLFAFPGDNISIRQVLWYCSRFSFASSSRINLAKSECLYVNWKEDKMDWGLKVVQDRVKVLGLFFGEGVSLQSWSECMSKVLGHRDVVVFSVVCEEEEEEEVPVFPASGALFFSVKSGTLPEGISVKMAAKRVRQNAVRFSAVEDVKMDGLLFSCSVLQKELGFRPDQIHYLFAFPGDNISIRQVLWYCSRFSFASSSRINLAKSECLYVNWKEDKMDWGLKVVQDRVKVLGLFFGEGVSLQSWSECMSKVPGHRDVVVFSVVCEEEVPVFPASGALFFSVKSGTLPEGISVKMAAKRVRQNAVRFSAVEDVKMDGLLFSCSVLQKELGFRPDQIHYLFAFPGDNISIRQVLWYCSKFSFASSSRINLAKSECLYVNWKEDKMDWGLKVVQDRVKVLGLFFGEGVSLQSWSECMSKVPGHCDVVVFSVVCEEEVPVFPASGALFFSVKSGTLPEGISVKMAAKRVRQNAVRFSAVEDVKMDGLLFSCSVLQKELGFRPDQIHYLFAFPGDNISIRQVLWYCSRFSFASSSRINLAKSECLYVNWKEDKMDWGLKVVQDRVKVLGLFFGEGVSLQSWSECMSKVLGHRDVVVFSVVCEEEEEEVPAFPASGALFFSVKSGTLPEGISVKMAAKRVRQNAVRFSAVEDVKMDGLLFSCSVLQKELGFRPDQIHYLFAFPGDNISIRQVLWYCSRFSFASSSRIHLAKSECLYVNWKEDKMDWGLKVVQDRVKVLGLFFGEGVSLQSWSECMSKVPGHRDVVVFSVVCEEEVPVFPASGALFFSVKSGTLPEGISAKMAAKRVRQNAVRFSAVEDVKMDGLLFSCSVLPKELGFRPDQIDYLFAFPEDNISIRQVLWYCSRFSFASSSRINLAKSECLYVNWKEDKMDWGLKVVQDPVKVLGLFFGEGVSLQSWSECMSKVPGHRDVVVFSVVCEEEVPVFPASGALFFSVKSGTLPEGISAKMAAKRVRQNAVRFSAVEDVKMDGLLFSCSVLPKELGFRPDQIDYLFVFPGDNISIRQVLWYCSRFSFASSSRIHLAKSECLYVNWKEDKMDWGLKVVQDRVKVLGLFFGEGVSLQSWSECMSKVPGHRDVVVFSVVCEEEVPVFPASGALFFSVKSGTLPEGISAKMAAKRVRQNAVRFSAVEDVKMDGLLFSCSVLPKELGFRPDQIDYLFAFPGDNISIRQVLWYCSRFSFASSSRIHLAKSECLYVNWKEDKMDWGLKVVQDRVKVLGLFFGEGVSLQSWSECMSKVPGHRDVVVFSVVCEEEVPVFPASGALFFSGKSGTLPEGISAKMAAKRVRQNAVRFSAVEDVKMDGLLFSCSVLPKELGFRPDQIDYLFAFPGDNISIRQVLWYCSRFSFASSSRIHLAKSECLYVNWKEDKMDWGLKVVQDRVKVLGLFFGEGVSLQSWSECMSKVPGHRDVVVFSVVCEEEVPVFPASGALFFSVKSGTLPEGISAKMAAKRVRQNAVRFSAVEDVKMDGLLFSCSVLPKELGFRPDQIDYLFAFPGDNISIRQVLWYCSRFSFASSSRIHLAKSECLYVNWKEDKMDWGLKVVQDRVKVLGLFFGEGVSLQSWSECMSKVPGHRDVVVFSVVCEEEVPVFPASGALFFSGKSGTLPEGISAKMAAKRVRQNAVRFSAVEDVKMDGLLFSCSVLPKELGFRPDQIDYLFAFPGGKVLFKLRK